MTLPPIQQCLKKLLISITGCEFDKDGSLVDWGYEHGRLRLHESEITELTHHLELREEAVKQETEKAFGGCTNCYGKGYATVQEHASGYDTDTDIGSPGGKVFFAQSPIKYCTCERGKQLNKIVASLSKPVIGDKP